MFAIAARRLGYRVHVLSPEDDTPTGQVADVEVRAPYDDLGEVARFARGVDVVTFEFENVPLASAEVAERYAPVRPGGAVLHATQNRIREKAFLHAQGLPLAPFGVVRSCAELLVAVDHIGFPAVLKTADWGYDGKGQQRIRSRSDLGSAWQSDSPESVLEALIDFETELSVVVARGQDGSLVTYGPIANLHDRHILDVSSMPALLEQAVADEALEIARTVAVALDLVGVLCVEMFLTRSGRLLVNEIAPRPHNSGHLTIDACATCQFEQQVRSICGLPLGSPEQHRPAAMANLLGGLWQPAPPAWERALAQPEVKLHLYGKVDPRPGRKMGHLTALAESPGMARQRVVQARAALVANPRTAPEAHSPMAMSN